MMGVMGVNAIRETFREDDCVRFHPIINSGGDLVNVIPDYVKMESYVRASNLPAMKDVNARINRALQAGAMALGAECDIHDLAGYLPMKPDENFRAVLRANAQKIFGAEFVTEGEHAAGSTDMGDVSHLMPVVHPWVGCVSGVSPMKRRPSRRPRRSSPERSSTFSGTTPPKPNASAPRTSPNSRRPNTSNTCAPLPDRAHHPSRIPV